MTAETTSCTRLLLANMNKMTVGVAPFILRIATSFFLRSVDKVTDA